MKIAVRYPGFDILDVKSCVDNYLLKILKYPMLVFIIRHESYNVVYFTVMTEGPLQFLWHSHKLGRLVIELSDFFSLRSEACWMTIYGKNWVGIIFCGYSH